MTLQGFVKKIIRIYNEYRPLSPVVLRRLKTLKTDKKKILLISHELSYTGAPIVLVNIAKILKKYDFEVVVLSYLDGGLEKELRKEKIPVYITGFLFNDSEKFKEAVKTFDLVIANTIVTYRSIWHLHGLVDFIWLIHEAQAFETHLLPFYSEAKHGCPPIAEVFNACKEIYTVSEYSKNVFLKYIPNIHLIYNGINDKYTEKQKQKNDKIIFSFVGTVNDRKAVDIIIEAAIALPKEYSSRISINIVGNMQNNFAKQLRQKAPDIVKWHDEIKDKTKIRKIYENTDLLICVSRDDPAPLVVTEAAMYGVPSVISENVGSTYLISDNESGFIIPTNDSEALKNVLIKVIDNPNILDDMSVNVRKKYLETSTMDKFEENFINIVKNKLSLEEVHG